MDIPRGADLRGARVVEADLRGARFTGCEVDDLRIDAFAGDLGTVVVEGVEVTGFVSAELDRRHPERVTVREARTAQDLRAAWGLVRGLWEQTLGDVPVELVDTRVLLDRPAPAPLGLPTTGSRGGPSETTRDDVRAVVPHRAHGPVTTTVRRCLLVVLHERVDHRRYALRDLAVAGRARPAAPRARSGPD